MEGSERKEKNLRKKRRALGVVHCFYTINDEGKNKGQSFTAFRRDY